MTPRQAFEAWAPPHAPWSAWAKPTLFVGAATKAPAAPGSRSIGGPAVDPLTAPTDSYLPPMSAPATPDDVSWADHIPKRAALILDMPGPTGIRAGLALRSRGYWPVPLYNATTGPSPVVHVGATAWTLLDAAPALAASPPREGDAHLPCFLIDDGRCPLVTNVQGRFDNRSIVFPQDFPSATRLKAGGVESVLVVHHTYQSATIPGGRLADDLAHVLYAWQRDGLPVRRFTPGAEKEPLLATIKRPGGFGLAIKRVLTLGGLHRAAAGGFGTWVPEASSGSGYS